MSSNIALSGGAYNNFIESIKSEATLQQYKYGLAQFMKFLNITDINNLMVLAAQDHKTVQQKIIDYMSYMKKQKGLAVITIQLYSASIMHFYSINDVILNRKKIGRYIPEHINIIIVCLHCI
jgi:site-specific recombinase XerD